MTKLILMKIDQKDRLLQMFVYVVDILHHAVCVYAGFECLINILRSADMGWA